MAPDMNDDDVLRRRPAKGRRMADPMSVRDPEDDEDDEDGDAEDQGGTGLHIPGLPRALRGKAGQKRPKAPKRRSKDGKARGKAGNSLGITVSDRMMGLGDGDDGPSGDDREKAAAKDRQSAYDRDEITNPDIDADEAELLTLLAGATTKPWENENLSIAERMILKQGYERHDPAIRQEKEKKAADRTVRAMGRTGLAAAVVAAAAVVVSGVKGLADRGRERDGAALAGISRGPRAAVHQDGPQAQSAETRKADSAARATALSADAIRVQRATSARGVPVTMARPGTSPRDDMNARQQPAPDIGDDLVDGVQAAEAVSGPVVPAGDEPDYSFRQMMDMIYASMGMDRVADISPWRQAMWEEKRLEQKENSADMTAPPPPETKIPAPEPQYRYDMQINLGPGGP